MLSRPRPQLPARPVRRHRPTARLQVEALEGRDVPSYSFVTVDYPGEADTHLQGINDVGQIVGYTGDASASGNDHAFVKSGNTFTHLDVAFPGVPVSNSYALGINNNGDIVGVYRRWDTGVTQHGFLLSGATYADVTAPGATDTSVDGINENGQIVGHFSPPDRGFIKTGNDYEIVHATPLGAARVTYTFAINNSGDVAGWYYDVAEQVHGFVRTSAGYSQIDIPGAANTQPYGINTAGTVVGFYPDKSGIGHGFVWTGAGYETLDYPGAENTVALGINTSGQIVGVYRGTDGHTHGFLATPVVNRVAPTITVTGGSFIYDGEPHPATGSVTGAGGVNLGTPSFTYSYTDDNGNVVTLAGPPIDPGYYTVTASFAGNAGYLPASATATITIAYDARTLTDLSHAFNAGRTIPIKIQLLDANGLNISSPDIILTAIRLVRVNPDGTRTDVPLQASGTANPNNQFRYDAALGGYIFNLSTKGLTAGTYEFSWLAGDDPTEHKLSFRLV